MMKKIINNRILSALLCIVSLSVWACSSDSGKEEEKSVAKTLTVDTNKIDFDSKENVTSVKISGTVSSWSISTSDASWIQLSQSSGSGTVSISIKALENTTTSARS